MDTSPGKLRLDIPVVLPHVRDAADACIERLQSELLARPGVDRVHIRPAEGEGPGQLCVHFDPQVMSLARIRELAQAAGARVTESFGHVTWTVTGIGHERRARNVAEQMSSVFGVLEARASSAGTVYLEFEREKIDEGGLEASLKRMGVARVATGKPSQHEDHAGHTHDGKEGEHGGEKHDHDHAGGLLGPNAELIFALTCGALLLAGFLIEKFAASLPGWLSTACYIGAYVFGGAYTLLEAYDNLKLKRFEIDTLMLVAAAGAAALGSWAEGALLLFLFSLGHALEHYAMGRAKRAIEALAELAPDTAIVIRGETTTEIPVGDLQLGDRVLVRPNERLPADGFLLKGNSSINQAPVTGESIPVDKRPVEDAALARSRPDSVDAASRVFAGTINGAGAIEVEVTKRAEDSALARVVKMVSEAETRKSATQRFTDRFERIFVPAVLVLAFLLLFAWVVVDEPFRDSFYRAMAVLVAASPCALAIATPSAVLSGIARAARGGVWSR